MKASVARPLRRPNLLNAGRITDVMLQDHHTVRQSKTIVRPVTASKSPAASLEGHTSGPCPSLFLAARLPLRSRLLLRRQMRGALRPSARPAFLRLPPLERLDVAARRLRLPPTKYFRHR